MSDLPPEVRGSVYSSELTERFLETIADIESRMAGHDGERKSSDLIAERFTDAGLEGVTIDSFEIDGWWRGSTTLSVGSRDYDSQHEVIALPGTPSGELESDLIDVGYGISEDLDGDIAGSVVLIRSDVPDPCSRWVHRLEKYATAIDRGARGFIYQNHIPGCLPPTGEIGWGNRPAPIPAIGVSKEVGNRIRRQLTTGNETARIDIDCQLGPATSRNVHGTIGPGDGQEILVIAHHDAHDISEGARDNGVGCTILVELARLLSNVEPSLRRRIRFLATGAEEVGLLGAREHLRNVNLEEISCVINIDGVGESRSPNIRTNGFTELAKTFDGVCNDYGIPLEIDDTVTVNNDAWPFASEGIPAVTIGSTTEAGGRGWGHTHADTLDKLDIRDVRALTDVFSGFIYRLARSSKSSTRRPPKSQYEALDHQTLDMLESFEGLER